MVPKRRNREKIYGDLAIKLNEFTNEKWVNYWNKFETKNKICGPI